MGTQDTCHQPGRARRATAWILWGVVAVVWGFVFLRGQRIAHEAQQRHVQCEILSEAISQSSAAMIEVDLQGSIVSWSDGARQLFGFEAPAAVGKSIDVLIPDRYRSQHHTAFAKSTTGGQSRVHQLSCVALTEQGDEVPVVLLVWTMPDRVITVALPRSKFMEIDTVGTSTPPAAVAR